MAIPPEQGLAHLRDLAAARASAAQARVATLRAKLSEAVDMLRRDFDAERVIVFGSVAPSGDAPTSDCDVDLAVTGLRRRDYFDALAALMDLFGGPVDLVRLEDAPDSLVARVQDEGEVL